MHNKEIMDNGKLRIDNDSLMENESNNSQFSTINYQLNVPQLRFPEFEEEWIQKKIGEIFFVSAGGDIDKKHVNKKKTEVFQYPIYANASENKGFYAYSDIYKVEPPVITVAGRGVYIGIAHARNHKFYPIVRLLVLKPKEEQNIDFFESRINKINLFIESTGVPQLTAPQISSYKIRYPKIAEQTKIATFLTAVDKHINLLQKKRAELTQYKKGVMQKLFSQELRFKKDDGSHFPNWEEKKLGDLGTFQTSSVDKLSKENEKKVYLVNYMNVYRHEDIKNSTRDKLQVVTAKENQIKSSDLKKGDILFTPSSETPTDIGHSVVIFEDLENTLFSYHLMRFRPNIKLDLLYSHYFCNVPQVLKQLSRFSTGSTRFTISVGNFSKVKVQLPSYKEQQKIANFLSSIDKSIEKVEKQIKASQLWKKGLLQKMFV